MALEELMVKAASFFFVLEEGGGWGVQGFTILHRLV